MATASPALAIFEPVTVTVVSLWTSFDSSGTAAGAISVVVVVVVVVAGGVDV
jgi:hypothetical protein